MATTQDIISELVSLTKAGKVAWAAQWWDGNNKPTMWQGSVNSCRFDVRTSGEFFTMADNHWKRLGSADTRELVELLQSDTKYEGKTYDTILKDTLECLKQERET